MLNRKLCVLASAAAALLPPPLMAAQESGRWARHPFPPVLKSGGAAAYDPVDDRIVLILDTNDTWSPGTGERHQVWVADREKQEWARVEVSGPPPESRDLYSFVYDPDGDRFLVFGGRIDRNIYTNRAYALRLRPNPTWEPVLAAHGEPPPGTGHVAVHDSHRGRLIVYRSSADLWALNLRGEPVWTPIPTQSDLSRPASSMAYRRSTDELLLYGAQRDSDVWSLSLGGPSADWTLVSTQGSIPDPHDSPAVYYDDGLESLVAYGGFARSDLWALDFAASPPTWSQVNAGGLRPPPHEAFLSTYAPEEHRLFVIGGRGALFPGCGVHGWCVVGWGRDTNESWSVSLDGAPVWQFLVPVPRPRRDHAAVLDTRRERMFVFGGLLGLGWFVQHGFYDNRLWRLDLDRMSWRPEAVSPRSRHEHSAVVDPHTSSILTIGGFDYEYGCHDSPPGPSYESGLWIPTAGGQVEYLPFPHPRGEDMGLVYDSKRDRFVAYGGHGMDWWCGHTMNWEMFSRPGVWVLNRDVDAWEQMETVGEPTPRSEALTIYDAKRDRMLVLGGAIVNTYSLGPRLQEIWALEFTNNTWTQLQAAGSPPLNGRQTIAYDELRDRILIGSYDPWALRLHEPLQWEQLHPTGGPIPPRTGQTTIYDPLGDRLIVFGGADDAGPYGGDFNDLWFLEFGQPAVRSRVELLPGGRAQGRTRGMLPVILYGSPDLDTADLLLSETTGNGAPAAGRAELDYDQDGHKDLLLRFPRQSMWSDWDEGFLLDSRLNDGRLVRAREDPDRTRATSRAEIHGGRPWEILENPARGRLRVAYPENPVGVPAAMGVPSGIAQVRVELIDVTGRLVRSTSLRPRDATLELAVDGIPTGVYFLRITEGSDSSAQKVLILN